MLSPPKTVEAALQRVERAVRVLPNTQCSAVVVLWDGYVMLQHDMVLFTVTCNCFSYWQANQS